jgi:hypothetical protein
MKPCEQCGQAPVAFLGAAGSGGRYCGECLHEKANLILDVLEVIRHDGAQDQR